MRLSTRPSALQRVVYVVALLLATWALPAAAAKSKKQTTSAAKSKSTQVVSKRALTEKTVPLRTHSIYAPYVDTDLQNRWFDFGGSTIINTNKHVRLTQDRPSQAGWLWSRLAIAPNSFEVEFEFRVDGKGNTLFGDGFAMWLTKTRAAMGPAFGSVDYWNGLGIFFDTYANSRHSYSFPRIYAIMNDGTKSYNIAKDGQSQELASCSIDFRRTDVTAKARLTYFKGKFTELAIQHDKWDKWQTCFVIDGLELPSTPFLGFSALTGDVSDEHDIISVSTSNIAYHPMPVSANKPPPRKLPGMALFSFLWTLIKWGALIGLLGVAGVQYRKWSQQKAAKRF